MDMRQFIGWGKTPEEAIRDAQTGKGDGFFQWWDKARNPREGIQISASLAPVIDDNGAAYCYCITVIDLR